VPRGDVPAAAAALAELLSRPTARSAGLAEAGTVLARYSWPEAARRTMAALESVGR
jgi:glycosyltransferase involved in cell wall biosynthesis